MRTTFADRLREIVGPKRNHFSKKSGVSMETLRQCLDRGASPSAEIAAKIASAAGVSLQWLVTGEGEKDLPSAVPEAPPAVTPPDRTLH